MQRPEPGFGDRNRAEVDVAAEVDARPSPDLRVASRGWVIGGELVCL